MELVSTTYSHALASALTAATRFVAMEWLALTSLNFAAIAPAAISTINDVRLEFALALVVNLSTEMTSELIMKFAHRPKP